MSRLRKINIPPEQAAQLLTLANRLEKQHATRTHKWRFKCLTHQYFALYTARQDLIRGKCYKCSYYSDRRCNYTKKPGEAETAIEDTINLLLYLSAVKRGVVELSEEEQLYNIN